jgi:hypothetical protein
LLMSTSPEASTSFSSLTPFTSPGPTKNSVKTMNHYQFL